MCKLRDVCGNNGEQAFESRTADTHSRAQRLQDGAEQERMKLQETFAKVGQILFLCLFLCFWRRRLPFLSIFSLFFSFLSFVSVVCFFLFLQLLLFFFGVSLSFLLLPFRCLCSFLFFLSFLFLFVVDILALCFVWSLHIQ